MKPRLLLIALPVFILFACRNDRQRNKTQLSTPKALEAKETSSYLDVSLKRGDGDLIESLYKERVSENADLKKLEESINNLDKSRNDSMEAWDDFNSKNETYYKTSPRHTAGIKDSLLRNKIELMIETSLKEYNASVADYRDQIAIINTKDTALSDLHTALKIVKTLPLIERYQHDHLPDIESLKGYTKKQDEAIRYADTLLKQQR